jgi:integrase/recombinase XerD
MVHGKGGKHRMIPLPQHMMQLLLQYVTQTHKTFESQNQEKTDILFPVRYGKRLKAITRQAFWMVLKDLWRQLGHKRTISPHQLRHSLATHLLKEGVHLRSLQLLLGHENITTVQIYTHVEVSHIRAVYDKKHPRS